VTLGHGSHGCANSQWTCHPTAAGHEPTAGSEFPSGPGAAHLLAQWSPTGNIARGAQVPAPPTVHQSVYWRALGLLVGLTTLSCGKLMQQAKANANVPPPPAASSAPAPSAPHAATKPDPGEPSAPRSTPPRYTLPFAWETSEAEPLAKARGFLREMMVDNQHNVSRGVAAFKPFAEKQVPRATVLTCSDSRVQSNAWDQTPENDDFVVRNIGNQVPNALGSLAYGVEELQTPVLLVIGHTGCGAVHAAMNKLEGVHGPIKKELEGLHLPELKSGSANQVWTAAVIANVNGQVNAAVQQFGERIQEGKLTVLGAVYDFRNDLRAGAGKLHLVNVNANTEPERLKAFAGALMLAPPSARAPSGNNGRVDTLGFASAPKRAVPHAAHE
jgi:carbonic anhydrase